MSSTKKAQWLAITAGIILSSTAVVIAEEMKEQSNEATVKCTGINSCRGSSKCKSATNTCNGQNTCRGLGVVMVKSEQECSGKGGVVVQE